MLALTDSFTDWDALTDSVDRKSEQQHNIFDLAKGLQDQDMYPLVRAISDDVLIPVIRWWCWGWV